jgi:hypothetical protein
MRAGGLGLMADRGWDRPFDDPIPLPRGRLQEPALTSRGFRTGARGARVASRDESLDTGRGNRWTDNFARIGVMRALNRHVERVFSPARKEHHWGRRQLARDR